MNVPVEESVNVTVAVPDGEPDALGVGAVERDALGEPLSDDAIDGDAEPLAVALAVTDGTTVRDSVMPLLCVTDSVLDVVAVRDPDTVTECVGVDVVVTEVV